MARDLSLSEPVTFWKPYGCGWCGGPQYRASWERERTCLHCGRAESLEAEQPTVAAVVGEDRVTELMAALFEAEPSASGVAV